MARTLKQLRDMSDEEVFAAYDKQAAMVPEGLAFWQREIERREAEHHSWQLNIMTWVLVLLTVAVAVGTMALVVADANVHI
jgi:hypothetical protein